jgi:hypothetical protein
VLILQRLARILLAQTSMVNLSNPQSLILENKKVGVFHTKMRVFPDCQMIKLVLKVVDINRLKPDQSRHYAE